MKAPNSSSHPWGVRCILLSLCCVFVLLTAYACSADDGDMGSADVDAGFDGGRDDVGNGADSGADIGPSCLSSEPGVDSDGDGLSDAIEDPDRDCDADPGETSTRYACTDADYLDDGQEDIDGNGFWDVERGEFNPRTNDSDDDGIPDDEEALAAVCVRRERAIFGTARLATSDGLTIGTQPGYGSVELAGTATVLIRSSDEVPGSLIGGIVDTEDGVIPVPSAVFAELAELGYVTTLHSESADEISWDLRFDVHGPDGADESEVIGIVLALMGLDVGSSMPPESVVVSRLGVRMQASFDGQRTRIVAAFSDGGAADAWLDVVDSRALTSGSRDTLRTQCEELAPAEQGELNLVVAVAPSAIAESIVGEVLEQLTNLVALRRAQDLPTRIWIVPTSGHLEGATGAPLGGAAYTSVDAAAAALETGLGGQDPRVWLNLQAFINGGWLGSSEATFIVLAGREDTEFREGEYLGRDGNSALPVQTDSEVTEHRLEYYSSGLAPLSGRLLIIAPGPDAGSHCARLDGAGNRLGVDAGDVEGPPVDAAFSFQSIIREVGGEFVDACNPRAAVLATGILERAARTHHCEAPTRAAINGTVLIAGEAQEVQSQSWADGQVCLDEFRDRNTDFIAPDSFRVASAVSGARVVRWGGEEMLELPAGVTPGDGNETGPCAAVSYGFWDD